MKTLKCFFLLPIVNGTESLFLDPLSSASEVETFYPKCAAMLNLVEREKSSEVFYDSNNIDHFAQLSQDLFVEFNSPQYAFYELLSNAKDIRDHSQPDDNCFYVLWERDSLSVRKTDNSTLLLAEMAKEKIQNANQSMILLNIESLAIQRPFIPIVKDCLSEGPSPKLVCLSQTTHCEGLAKWIVDNRPPRQFHLNPKHGENGKGAKANKGEPVSVLLCDRQRAQALLENAVGDRRVGRELYNFDAEHQKYIVFKDEGTETNSYHGYHVENENEVPAEIRNLLQQLGVSNRRSTN